MAVFSLFLLLLADFGLSAGGEPCAMVYVAPGGTALLHYSDSEVVLCPGGNCTFVWKKNGSEQVAKIKNGMTIQRCQPNCQAFPNGSLELSEITPEDTRDYSVEVALENGTTFYKCFQLQLREPVSVPEVNYTCRPNASVQLTCSVENGTHPSYSWSLDEDPSWTPTKETMRGYQSVLRNVTCSARNEISEERSDPTNITCPDPVSVPEVLFKCMSKGRVRLTCHAANGTDLSFSWTVNGTEEDNRTSSVELTIGNELIEVNCTARNQISESGSNRTSVTCMDRVSEPEVEATCAPNGTVRLICLVANGTEPLYSWSVNGTQQNASAKELTVDAAVMLTVTCTARNLISQRESRPVNVTCTETTTAITTDVTVITTTEPTENSTSHRGRDHCMSRYHCILWSALGGVGVLVVTALPLLIGCLYTMPSETSL